MATGNGVASPTCDNKIYDSSSKTDFTVLKSRHMWEINNFSYCWIKPGEKLESPIFSSKSNSKIKWRLTLYPTGRTDELEEYASLYLTLVESYKAEIRVKYKFFILNEKGEASNLHENAEGAKLLQNWDEHKPSCGIDKFVSRSFLMGTETGLLPDDKLTISCELCAATIIPNAMTPYSRNILHADGWGYTNVKVVELSYLWTISNFSFCKEKTGDSFFSPVFSAKSDNSLQWKLELYPNGVDEANKEHISIYLYPAKNRKVDVQASFGFEIVRAKSEKVNHSYTLRYEWNKDDNDGYGCDEWRKRGLLLDTANELLLDDKLIIHCAIRYVTGTVNISPESESKRLQAPKRRRLNDDLEVLLENEKFSDVTLVVDEKELRAHKAILAARSPVFSEMFECKSEEANEAKVKITDINYETLREMLGYIYTGTLSVPVKHEADLASALLAAADFYNLKDLKFKCEQELYPKLGIENAADFLILAEKYSARQLKTKTIDFINANAAVVMDSQGFKQMSACYPQLIAEIGMKRLLDLKKN